MSFFGFFSRSRVNSRLSLQLKSMFGLYMVLRLVVRFVGEARRDVEGVVDLHFALLCHLRPPKEKIVMKVIKKKLN